MKVRGIPHLRFIPQSNQIKSNRKRRELSEEDYHAKTHVGFSPDSIYITVHKHCIQNFSLVLDFFDSNSSGSGIKIECKNYPIQLCQVEMAPFYMKTVEIRVL